MVFHWEAKKYKFSGKDIYERANLWLNWLLVQAILDFVICYVLEIFEFSSNVFEFSNDTGMRVSL